MIIKGICGMIQVIQTEEGAMFTEIYDIKINNYEEKDFSTTVNLLETEECFETDIN